MVGNVYVITGGTDGIGKSIVEKIISEDNGFKKIIVNYGHNENKARELKESIEVKYRERLEFIKADMSDYDSVTEFAGLLKKGDKIDRLICNVGVGEYAAFDDYTIEKWNRVINTNLTNPVFLIKELKDHMNKGGSIMLMASYAGINAYSTSLVYGVSKAGVVFLAKTLVKELEKYGVTVNAVAPGFVETSWQAGRSDESRERIDKKIALHRFATPEEVADIAFDVMNNGYMNGSVIEIHGGYEYF